MPRSRAGPSRTKDAARKKLVKRTEILGLITDAREELIETPLEDSRFQVGLFEPAPFLNKDPAERKRSTVGR
jgi:hypothetical protein